MSSFASYIKRRSRVVRRGVVFSSGALGSILEEPIILPESPAEKKLKKNSLKQRRRLGVPNLSTSVLLTSLDDSEWRLQLPESLLEDKDQNETMDFPRPPIPIFESPYSDESESSSGSESGEGSRSGPESPMSSCMPTTPTEEDSLAAELQGQCVIRCKSIKPLTVTKRSVSPSPSVAFQTDSNDHQDSDMWQDDDEYYAVHASSFITLAPPLPLSFPSSAATTNAVPRRQSTLIPPSTACPSVQLDPAYVPHRASVRLSRAITIPTRAPPPPPIITSGAVSSTRIAISVSPSVPPSRPPPRTPVPIDARLSDDYTTDSVPTYAPFVASRTPSPSSSRSGSTLCLAALLSPPSHSFSAEAQGVPSDVEDEDEDGTWEECADEYDEVPLSPLNIASAPSLEFEDVSAVEEAEENWTVLPSPYTGWHPRPRASQLRLAVEPLLARSRSPSPLYSPSHPLYCTAPVAEARQPPSPSSCADTPPLEPQTPALPTPQSQTPALRSRWSASTSAVSPCFQGSIPETPALPAVQPQTPALHSRWSASTSAPSPYPQDITPETPALRSRWSASTSMTSAPPTPALRSRWSSSTLSSTHSAHAHAASPKTFSFARRYFPKVKSPARDAPKSPAFSKSSRTPPRPMGSATVFRARKQRKLTVADVQVQHLVVGRPPDEPSVLACASPDVFSSSFSAPSPGTPQSSASGQWAAYPASPGPAPALYPLGEGVPSSALYAAYTTQRSPRRRASNASSASAWSLAHSSASAAPSSSAGGSGGSESGHSECSNSSSGLRRKPIPVEMFLR
ncbi:hypothetical protein B0H12DRAFT_1109755 [Mycena haematopus]|nr:hypothetical protein B0H12DRAFT_1109755 [Mycena haematopus]